MTSAVEAYIRSTRVGQRLVRSTTRKAFEKGKEVVVRKADKAVKGVAVDLTEADAIRLRNCVVLEKKPGNKRRTPVSRSAHSKTVPQVMAELKEIDANNPNLAIVLEEENGTEAAQLWLRGTENETALQLLVDTPGQVDIHMLILASNAKYTPVVKTEEWDDAGGKSHVSVVLHTNWFSSEWSQWLLASRNDLDLATSKALLPHRHV